MNEPDQVNQLRAENEQLRQRIEKDWPLLVRARSQIAALERVQALCDEAAADNILTVDLQDLRAALMALSDPSGETR